jgi:Uma2 family endonuclease
MSATTSQPTPVPLPATKPRRRKRGRAVVIPFVNWETYEQLLEVFEERPRIRLTYDRGDLEIMVPSQEHEKDGEFLARMIVIMTEEFGLPLQHGGSTTLKRKRMKKGLEPDKCFWIANAAKVAGVKQLNLKIHPPPDLAIEVDVSRSSLDRFGIFRTLGVGELWRLDGDDLYFHVLGTDGKYTEVPTSRTFAGIAPADLMVFVKQSRNAVDQNMPAAGFRAWVKQRLAAPPASQPPATP